MCKTDSSNLVATGCFIQLGILCLFDFGDVHLKRKLFHLRKLGKPKLIAVMKYNINFLVKKVIWN